MKIKNILFGTFFSLILGLGIIACNDTYRIDVDKNQGTEGYSKESENVLLKFDLEGLKFGTPSTRALSKKGENEIAVDKVRMLVFGQDNKFSYEAKITSITPTNTDESEGSLILLAKNTSPGEQNTFVLLTNVQPSSNPDVSAFAGKLKEEVLKLFTFNIADNSAWADGQLPMWGTLGPIEVNHSTGPVPNLGTIHLIRAVARVDVGLNLSKDIAGASQFDEIASGIPGIKLSNVFIYNTNKSGYVAPFADDPNIWDSTHRKAKAPSLQSSPAPVIIPEISKSSDIKDEKILLREIYLPEAINTPKTATQAANGETLPEDDQTNYMKRPYIVVGLIGADESNPTKETFFRIDYLKRIGEEATATYEYLSLLRNHRYLVNITSVGGPGFDNVEDAKKGPAANIMYNVVVWNESQMSNVKYDGQYMLGVSEDHFTFYREGGSLTAKVQTSWPDGFTVENLPDWITYTVAPADPSATGNTDEKIVTFNVTEHVTEDRTYPVDPADAENALKAAYVQAGRMKWFLNFKQSKDLKVAIEIFSDPECTQHLEFIDINQYGQAYGTPGKVVVQNGHTLSEVEAGAIVTFYVKTEPNIEPVIETNGNERFVITKIDNLGGGVWKYTATAPDITENSEPFDHIVTNYNFSITHTGTGKSASTKLILQQLEHNAIPYHDKELTNSLIDPEEEYIYLMEGTDRQFWVKGNTNYKIELVSAPANNGLGDVVQPFTPVEESDPSLSGKPITFTPVDDLTTPRLFEGIATFRISSPLGLFPTRDFKVLLVSAIKQPEANCYMIKKGAKQGILIPVSRVNTAADYYDRLLNRDAVWPSNNTNPYPLPGNSAEPYRLNRLDPDDDWTVNIVWTDIHDTSKTTILEQSGLKRLSHAGGKGADNSYILLQVGDVSGNILIQIRSAKLEKRNALWSWHIWIVDEYPTVKIIDRSAINGSSNGANTVELMSHLLGAFEEPNTRNYDDDNWRVFGMMYQWGRKDPFAAYDVAENREFYDNEGKRFVFAASTKGDRQDRGRDDALEAAGASFTMKASIENPQMIIAHQTFWNYEMMPFRYVRYFYKKAVFRYPWNRMPTTGVLEDNTDFDSHVGKTVFDPSPYGFRIMNQSESITLRWAYDHFRLSNLLTPLPGTIYDGDYLDSRTGNDECIFGVAQARHSHAGGYLLNSIGGDSGWQNASYTNSDYRRALTVSIRPVLDPEKYGDPSQKDYTEYLPQ